MGVRLGKGRYTFRDLNTKRIHIIKSTSATNAVRKINRKLGKKVNYSFIGFKK